MHTSDVFLLVVRWLHLISASLWVGGGLFYLLVLKPVIKRNTDFMKNVDSNIASEFKSLVDTAILVLLVTGIILTFNRLTPDIVGVEYVLVLSAKIVMSLFMFTTSLRRRKRTIVGNYNQGFPEAQNQLTNILRMISGYNALVILGIIVFLISDLLKIMYESALAGQ